MACGITSIDQTSLSDCGSLGGIFESYGLDCADFTSATVSGGEITGLTVTEEFTKLVYDDDDTAFYNQEADRTGNRISFNQTAFFKFEKLTKEKIAAANSAAECCCTIWIHRLNSGIDLLQGLDEDDAGTGVLYAKTKAKVTPSVLSDTGDNADRLEYSIESVGRKLSLPIATALDYTDLVT
jgi:hypothetical protein